MSKKRAICKKCNKMLSIVARGLCHNCYRKDMAREIICTKCGKRRRIHARNMCTSCYQKASRANWPERQCEECGKMHRHIRKGLCPKCYKKQWNKDNMEHILEYNAQWVKENHERHRDNQKRYERSEKGKKTLLLSVHQRRQRLVNAGGDGLSRKEWDAIKQKQNHRCYYCGSEPKRFEIEHLTPLSRGGLHDPKNIVASCKQCNLRKGTMTEEEFKEKLKGEG